MKNFYKKHKSHIIYSIKFKKGKFIFITMLFIFNISFLFTFKQIEMNFQPVVKALAISKAGTYTISVINKSIDEIPEKDRDYSVICNLNKNTEGEIISVTANSSAINNFKKNLSNSILKNIENPYLQELGIPIGNLTNTYILSGRGPKIPIKILNASSPHINIESDFETAGVNQTKHKITIAVDMNIHIVLPYETVEKTITYETLLSETIIVGKVPNVYVSK